MHQGRMENPTVCEPSHISQSRYTQRSLLYNFEEQSIPYSIEGGSDGATANLRNLAGR